MSRAYVHTLSGIVAQMQHRSHEPSSDAASLEREHTELHQRENQKNLSVFCESWNSWIFFFISVGPQIAIWTNGNYLGHHQEKNRTASCHLQVLQQRKPALAVTNPKKLPQRYKLSVNQKTPKKLIQRESWKGAHRTKSPTWNSHLINQILAHSLQNKNYWNIT